MPLIREIPRSADSSPLSSAPLILDRRSLTSDLCSRFQNFTRIARLIRFSIFFRSGVHNPVAPQPLDGATLPSRHTRAPGAPKVLPSGGVTPPGPDQYGTFVAR